MDSPRYSLAKNLSEENLPLGERTRKFIFQKKDEVMRILNNPASLTELFGKKTFTAEDLSKLTENFNEVDARIYLSETIFRNSPFPIAIFREPSSDESTLAEANSAYCDMVRKALDALMSDQHRTQFWQLREQGNPIATNLARYKKDIDWTDTFQLIKNCSSKEIGECIYSPSEWKRIEKYIFEASETGRYTQQIVCTPLHGFPFAWDNTRGVRIGMPLQHYVEHQLFRDKAGIVKTEGFVEHLESQKIDFQPHDFIANTTDSTNTNTLIRNITFITQKLIRSNDSDFKIQLGDLHIFDEILENRQFALAVYDRTLMRKFVYGNSFYLQSAGISLARTIRLDTAEKERIIRAINNHFSPLIWEEKTREIITQLNAILSRNPDVLEKNLEVVRTNLNWLPEFVLRCLIYPEEEVEKIQNLNTQADTAGRYNEPTDCTMTSEQTFKWDRQILDGKLDTRYGMPVDNFYKTLFASMYAPNKKK